MPHLPASAALARFRVVDLTQVRAGPTCCRQLADWGADVIQVQMPEHMRGDDTLGGQDGSDYQYTHRNKRSITLDLKQPEGIALLKRLIDGADVVVENFRPDVKGRLGIDYETLSRDHPRLVYEISFNTYKPFACGIVIHPSIDACVQLREQGVRAEDVERIELKVHSLVLELTGKKEPADGLAAKFSVYHGCAAGLVFGRAGEPEYADDIVTREDVVALRRKVVATVDDTIDEASADVTAVLRDGQRVHVFVEHAIGSLQRPMSDAALAEKFAAAVLGAERTARLNLSLRVSARVSWR